MSVLDSSTSGASWEEMAERMRRIREYSPNASDPNEMAADGRTLLLFALLFCSTAEGEQLVADLLDRGADPNKPTAWTTFSTLLTASNSIQLVEKFVEKGLELNQVYEVIGEGHLTDGPSTLIDYVHEVRTYISPSRKGLAALDGKHSGRLGNSQPLL